MRLNIVLLLFITSFAACSRPKGKSTPSEPQQEISDKKDEDDEDKPVPAKADDKPATPPVENFTRNEPTIAEEAKNNPSQPALKAEEAPKNEKDASASKNKQEQEYKQVNEDILQKQEQLRYYILANEKPIPHTLMYLEKAQPSLLLQVEHRLS